MQQLTRRHAIELLAAGCLSSLSSRTFACESSDARRKRISEMYAVNERPDDLPDGIGIRDPFFSSQADLAFVIDGSVIAFRSAVPREHKHDVALSLLLAQRAATKKVSRFDRPPEWYAIYHQVLETIGWIIEDFSFAKFHPNGETFTISNDVIGAGLKTAAAADIAVLKLGVEAMNAISVDDERLVLFEHSSRLKGKGSAQFGVVDYLNDIATMILCGVYYESKQDVVRSLSFEFGSPKAEVYIASQTLTLNDAVFGPLRDALIAKLKDQPKVRIKNIDF